MSLVVTSVTLFLSEALFAFCFLAGLFAVCQWVARYARRRMARRAYVEYRGWVPSERFLTRFAFYQIVFVAVWSVLFKAVLYTSLSRPRAHYLMADGQSLFIAIGAECLLAVCVLIGFVKYLGKLVRANEVARA